MLTLVSPASAQEPTRGNQSADEQTIWQLESAYFAHFAKGNVAALGNLWHPDFVGWPAQSSDPVYQDEARRTVMELLSGPRIVSVGIRAKTIVLRGDVAVTHYFVDMDQDTAEGETSRATFRVTHTWIREGGTWRVIGGMSAEQR
jgi:ketosteroid isomerase-like protein